MKVFASMLAATACALAMQPALAAKLDAGLYTNYSFVSGGQYVIFSVCGTLSGTEGCVGSGDLANDRACAVIEGKSKQVGNVITRYVYVFDKRNSSSNPALVNVFERTDTINGPSDTVQ